MFNIQLFYLIEKNEILQTKKSVLAWILRICPSNHLLIPVVPHKAVAEVSRRGKLYERLVVVSHECQSKNTDTLTN